MTKNSTCAACDGVIKDDWVRVIEDGYQYHVRCYTRMKNELEHSSQRHI
jgi:hypothetical protein